jgi:hypothetical protein
MIDLSHKLLIMRYMSHIISISRLILNTMAFIAFMPLGAHGQYLMAENLQEEVMCRAALHSCLQPVKCTVGNAGGQKYCKQNQCTIKEYLTYGDGKKNQPLKVGSILTSSVESPFMMDSEAAIYKARILDCEDPVAAKAILKSMKLGFDKSSLAPTLEAASSK